MLMRDHPKTRQRRLPVGAAVASLVYFVLAGRFAWRIASNDLYPDTRNYLLGWLATTVVLYAVCLAVSISERERSGSGVPVVGASLFGSLMCVLFYGP